MSSPYALFRLMWRGSSVSMLWLIAMAVALPLLRLEDSPGGPFHALWRAGADPLVRSAAWQLVLVGSAAIGFAATMMRGELLVSGLGWWLPGIRRGWLAATLLIAVPVATGMGAVIARGGARGEAVAAVAISLACFALPGALIRTGLPRAIILGIGSVFLLGIMVPAQLGGLVAGTPVVAGLLAAVAAFAGFRHQFSVATARKQLPLAESIGRLWESRFTRIWAGGDGEWTGSLATDRLRHWLVAMGFEAGYHSLGRYTKSMAWDAVMGGILIRFMNNPTMLVVLFGIMAGNRGVGLESGLLYPLSRNARARLRYLGVLLDAILHLAGIGLVLLGLQQLPIPEGWTLKLESGRISWLGAVGLALALLPVTLWGRVTAASISWTIPDRFLARRFGPVFLYALLAVIATRVLKLAAFAASNAFVPATVLVLVGAGLYLLLWWATRRHFTKADLVTSSA